MIVALAAVLISLCALVATIYEANLQRKGQLLSVWPNLSVVTKKGDNGYHIAVANKGLGPALVKTFRVEVDNQPVYSWQETIESLDISGNFHTQTHSISSNIISANEETIAFAVSDTTIGNLLSKADARIQIEICYCSVYEDCWLVKKDEPVKVVEKCDVTHPTTSMM